MLCAGNAVATGQLCAQPLTGAAQAKRRGVRGALKDGCNLAGRKGFPRRQAQDLLIFGVKACQRVKNVRGARRHHLCRPVEGDAPKQLAVPLAGPPLIGQSAVSDPVQPGQRGAGRDVVETAPRGREYLGDEVVGFRGRQTPAGIRVQRLVARVEHIAVPLLAFGHGRRLWNGQPHGVRP